MKKFKILVVEDETDVRELISLHLRREGYDLVAVEDAEKAMVAMNQTTPDAADGSSSAPFHLAVVDWMLPGVSGLEWVRWVGAQGRQLPILMVTARADSADIVRGLEAGADDYVTKPFEVPVFLARVRALLRRGQVSQNLQEQELLQIADLRLNTKTYDVSIGEEKLNLTPSEFKLLKSLMQSQGKVLSRDKLIELVQGEGVSVVDRAIDTHVFGLRKKLGTHADFVETIRGVGYRMKSAND
jgi:DNA-binding response OmpR family regulator